MEKHVALVDFGVSTDLFAKRIPFQVGFRLLLDSSGTMSISGRG